MKRTFFITTIVSALLVFLVGYSLVTTAQTLASNPILLVVNDAASNKFGRYYGEILRAEGLNSYDVMTTGAMSASTLAQYRVVILAETTLTPSQAADFSTYVTGGGYLIAMRPDSKVKGLFGLGARQNTQSDGYLRLNGSGPSAGLPKVTLQIHGAIDQYSTAADAVSLAQLYTDATNITIYPAVVQDVTGHSTAFNFDLATNIILMRQGNPANANLDIDNDGVTRSIELFQGVGGAAPWVDLNKVPIPQADEQQRFFARLILQAINANQPTPQMWYFPDTNKTMMVLTGDAHANPAEWYQNEVNILDTYNAKMTFYMSITSAFTETNLQNYRANGFEFGIHPTAYHPDPNYAPYNILTLSDGYRVYTDWFATAFPSIPESRTVRNHQLAWSGWTDAAELAIAKGLEMDANFYNWGPWLQKPDTTWAHGYITGSGQPMKFIKADGTILPYYQQLTELVDEQMYPVNPGYLSENLSDSAAIAVSKQMIDASEAGNYAALMTQLHVDYVNETGVWINGTLGYAQLKNIPMWNADHWLSFTKTRHDANYTNFNWDSSKRVLKFNMEAISTAGVNLSTMLSPSFRGSPLISVSVDGLFVTYTTQTINGVEVVFVTTPAGNHSFIAVYQTSDLPNAPPNRNYYTALPLTLTWNPVTSAMQYEVQVALNNNFVLPLSFSTIVPRTSLSATITSLPGDTYYWRVRAQDIRGVWGAWSTVDKFTLQVQ
ncbi:MAG: hypothetical protein H0X30_07450 [Anaerolineae bacterium]|nr:hypothetical protein [Anaerolineae bacterium]